MICFKKMQNLCKLANLSVKVCKEKWVHLCQLSKNILFLATTSRCRQNAIPFHPICEDKRTAVLLFWLSLIGLSLSSTPTIIRQVTNLLQKCLFV